MCSRRIRQLRVKVPYRAYTHARGSRSARSPSVSQANRDAAQTHRRVPLHHTPRCAPPRDRRLRLRRVLSTRPTTPPPTNPPAHRGTDIEALGERAPPPARAPVASTAAGCGYADSMRLARVCVCLLSAAVGRFWQSQTPTALHLGCCSHEPERFSVPFLKKMLKHDLVITVHT